MILINVSESFGMSLVISHMNERNGNLSLFFLADLSQSIINPCDDAFGYIPHQTILHWLVVWNIFYFPIYWE